MEIQRIQVENFFSYGPAVEVDFTKKSSPCLVQGKVGKSLDDSNGAGKSSLFEAFHWCLTGRTVRGVRAKEVLRSGQTRVFVEAQFTHNGSHWKVFRLWSEKSKQLVVFIDDNPHEFHDARQATEELFRMLGVSQEVFSLLTFTGRKFISFSGLSPKERAELVDTVVDGSYWKRAAEFSGRALSSTRSSLQSCRQKVQQLEDDLKEATRQAQAKEQELTEFKEEVCVWERRKVQDKVSEAEPLLLQAKEKVQATEQELLRLVSGMEEAQGRIAALEEEMQKAGKDYEDLFHGHAKYIQKTKEAQGKVSSLDEHLLRLQKEAEEMDRQDSTKKCPKCGQSMPDSYSWEDHKRKREKLQQQMEQTATEAAAKEKEMQELQKKEQSLKDKLELAKERKQEVAASSTTERRQVGAVVSSYKEKEQLVVKARLDVNTCERRLEEAKQEAGRVEVYIASTQSRLEQQVSSLRKEESKLKEKEKTQRKEESSLVQEESVYEYWKKGFKDIYYSKFDTFLKFFEALLNDYCWRQGLDVDCVSLSSRRQLSTGEQKPEITLTVKRGEELLSLDSLSEGETQRMDLAVFLSLRTVLSKFAAGEWKFVVMDEPLSGLDLPGREEVFGIVSDMAQEAQVFVVDHNADFKSRFASTLTVVKEDFSRVEDG